MTQWVGFAGSCTVFFHVLELFLWKAGRHICNAPWKKKNKNKKRDQNEIKTRSKRDHRSSVEDFGIFWAHMCRTRAHKFTHLCTRSHQPTSAPTFRLNFAPADASRSSAPAQPSHTCQPNGKHPRSSTPAQRCAGASQIISTPSSAPAQPCKHARLVQVRGKARWRLEPAVAKETSSLKIAKHTVNAPRRIR